MSGSAPAVLSEMLRRPTGRVLDCPCGQGWLAGKLSAAGFEVACADIDPGLAGAHGTEADRVDLNRDRLPYDDGSFEYVACAGGLHRLSHVRRALDEFHRVLKPGGGLVIGTVNNGSLMRRLRFLFTGSIGRRLSELPSTQLGETPEAGFRTGLTCREIVAAAGAAGFEAAASRATRTSLRAVALLPLGVLVWMTGRLFVPPGAPGAPGEPLGVVLGGRHAVVVARKPGAP